MSIANAYPVWRALDRVQQNALTRFYRPELDVLRFCAFLCVFLCHSMPPGLAHKGSNVLFADKLWWAIKDAGNFGVCIFFVLSAYLITELMRRELVATATVHLKSFYVRRILRIWPLYFFMLAAYVILGKVHPSLKMEYGRTVANLLLVGNWYIFFHPFITSPLRALWSISVEEQFYLAWPAITKAVGMLYMTIISVVLIIISTAAIYVVSVSNIDLSVTVWVNSFVQFQFFALGALLAIYLSGAAPQFGRVVRCLMLGSGSVLWLTASGVFRIKRPGTSSSPLPMVLGYEIAAIGTILIFLAVLGIGPRLLPKFLIYLGKISYGLYVFHETGFLLADNVQKLFYKIFAFSHLLIPQAPLLILNKTVALAATIAMAMLSYRFLEAPLLNVKRRFTFIASRSV